MNHVAPLGLENTLNDQVYKHVAPLALNAWPTQADALSAFLRGRIETAARLDALLPAILDRAFRGES